jgi:predicted transcriptional regulator
VPYFSEYLNESPSSLRYFMRIIAVLEENPTIGISNLVTLTGINHQRLNMILEAMEKRGYLTISTRRRRKTIIVTREGLENIRKLTSIPLPL